VRIRRPLAAVVVALALGGAGFATSAGTAHAATGGNVTAVTALHARPDSGFAGNNWANDAMTRTATVTLVGPAAALTDCGATATSCFNWKIAISDTGTAFAVTGQTSPGAQGVPIKGTPSAAVTGTMTGTFTASSNTADSSLVPAALTGSSVSSGNWAKQFFPAATTFDVTHATDSFSYTYKDTKDCQQWVDANNVTQANSGDITGVDNCATALTAPGNQTVTVGSPASFQLFGSTTSSDKTLAYTVTSGALPDGLSLNAATGLVSGTPKTGAVGGTVEVTVADFGGVKASQSFGITVKQATAPPPPPVEQPVVLSHGGVVPGSLLPTRAIVTWTATPANKAAKYKVTLVGPNFPGGRTAFVTETKAGYTGLAHGHTYVDTITPLNAAGAPIGATGHVTFVTP
jgi:hypothetical protein